MVAVFTRGTSWALDGDSIVNDSDLHSLIESATVAGVSRANLDRTKFFYLLSRDIIPSDLSDLEPWCDTTQAWAVTKLANGNAASLWAAGEVVTASEALLAGEVVCATGITSGIPDVKKCTTADRDRLSPYGVMATQVASGSTGIAITAGVCAILSEHTSGNQGKPFYPSTITDGKIEISGAKNSGHGPFVMGHTISPGQSAGHVWAVLKK